METIKVNMNPNPLDVQTIHASQNDNEARQWGFELHNNGEKIDSSSISDQLVFKAYKGGTEQILPENGAVPVTAPFVGDIKYPDATRTDQEFLYRQSPTEEDGLAKITDIKGNTLVWNQLASVVGEQTSTVGRFDENTHVYSGHKYLMTVEATPTSSNTMYLSIYYNNGSNSQYGQVTGTSSGKYALFFNCDYTASGGSANVLNHFWFYAYNASSWKNLMLFDLTALGLDSITDPAEFTSLFPLPYYDYNAGTLLSFNGTGLKSISEDESKEDTLALPVATYFPNGMRSAGTAYDELTPTKAITKLIKTIVDGTNKTANYYGVFQEHQLFYVDLFATTHVNISNVNNLKSNHYLTASSVTMGDRYIRYQTVSYPNINIGRIYWNDDRYTSADAMNTALQSSPLEIVSLAQSETVENFSVASLVTENAEIPLSNEDGVLIGKCTEELSADAGFIEGKIKLSDEDGDVYSNKIQIHVERKPS